MVNKIIRFVVLGLILICWPLSLINKPPKIKLQTIFYQDNEEIRIFQTKLALDDSPIKRIYYNKFTLVKDRYFKNVFVLFDLNNYFFKMHPRSDVGWVEFRDKFPPWSFLLLFFMLQKTLNKKYIKYWLAILIEILIISFFRNVDGWDFCLYFPIAALILL